MEPGHPRPLRCCKRRSVVTNLNTYARRWTNSRLRIAMICPQQDIPPHALDAADGLCSQGHSVTVYCTKAPLRRVKDSPSPQYCQCDIGILRLLLLIPHPIMGIFVLFLRALCMTIRMFVASYYYDAIMLYNTADRSVDLSTVVLFPLSLCGLHLVYCWCSGRSDGRHYADGRICPSRKCQRMYERLVVTYASAIIVDSEPRKEWCESCYGRRVRDIMVAYRPVEARGHCMNRRSLLEVDRTLGAQLGDRPFILAIVNPSRSDEMSLTVDGYAHYYHNPNRLLPVNKALGAEVIHNTTSRPAGQASTLTSPAAVISPVSSDATFFLDTVTGMYQEERDASLGSGDSEPLSEHEEGSTGCVHSSPVAFDPVAVAAGLPPPRLILACCEDSPDGHGLSSIAGHWPRDKYTSMEDMAALLENEVTAMCLNADDDVKVLSISWNSPELDWLCYHATVGLYTPLDTTDPAMLMRLMGCGRPVISTRGQHDSEGLININAGCVVDPPSAQGLGVALVALLHHTPVGILEGMGAMALERLESRYGFSTFSQSLDSFIERKLFTSGAGGRGPPTNMAAHPFPRISPVSIASAEAGERTATPSGSIQAGSINASLRLRRRTNNPTITCDN